MKLDAVVVASGGSSGRATPRTPLWWTQLEQRFPITEILAQTPDIPEGCQWAIFLRNHDELTLEKVSEEERDYMVREYVKDPRMSRHMGIGRRLAPLLDGDRRLAELLYALVFSLPGSPVIYYGDELLMGDNLYLGDRDSVRTPMQWSPDRNGGFSRADFAQLYLPPVMDPVYGYQALNVEAEQRKPTSLLHWIRRMLQARRQYPVFGTGAMEQVQCPNPSVLAYVRLDDSHDAGAAEVNPVLCVHNLSRFAQPAWLELGRWAGRVPMEVLGRVPFPVVGEGSYGVTLGPYGYYWFDLVGSESLDSEVDPDGSPPAFDGDVTAAVAPLPSVFLEGRG